MYMNGQYKLGKLAKLTDRRTIQFQNILSVELLPTLPLEFDVDNDFTNMVDNHMYLNDALGDCVIAGRAHETLRIEDFEQGIVIPISDNDVKTEYFKETGGYDNGLVMLTSLGAWRNGWQAAGKTYSIYAFAEIDPKNHQNIMYAVYLLDGAYVGIQVPQSAMDQFNAGKPWTVVAGSPLVGGHCIYIVGYNATGPICITWGKKQQMTWEFFDTYCDEAYAVIDNKDSWVDPATDPLDIVKLESYLQQIAGGPINPPTPPLPPPNPSPCPVGNGAAKLSNVVPWIFHRKGRFYYFNPPEKNRKV